MAVFDKTLEIDKLIRNLGAEIAAHEVKERITELYEDAMAEVLNYTGQTSVQEGVAVYIRQLATIKYNQQGAEGETSRSEGGISQSFEVGLPKQIRTGLNRYRVAKVRRF